MRSGGKYRRALGPVFNGGERGVVVPWGAWSIVTGGTGIAADPTPPLMTVSSTVSSPAGLGQGTTGVTCTGLARDAARSRYILGNHGQSVEGSASPATSSLITLDSSLAKTGEVALDYGSPYSAITGVQGVAVDTIDDVVGVAVPPIPGVTLFDPTTLTMTGRLDLTGIVAQPNALAFDSTRNAWWVGDNTSLSLRLVSKTGAVLDEYAPTSLQNVGLDMADYLSDLDWLVFTSGGGSSGTPGRVWAYDCTKRRIVSAGRAAEALAPEGGCRSLDGTQFIFASDGEYHATTPYAIPAPNNVNQLLRYAFADITSYRYSRQIALGVNNRFILDMGDGTASTDFSIFTNTITTTVTNRRFRFRAQSNDGQTYAIFWRLGSTIFQGSVGPAPVYCELPGMTVSGSASFQIGLRKGGAPYNTSAFCDITIGTLRLM